MIRAIPDFFLVGVQIAQNPVEQLVGDDELSTPPEAQLSISCMSEKTAAAVPNSLNTFFPLHILTHPY